MTVVHTPSGSLRGALVGADESVSAFLGVPYAEPPVGDLRFRPAVPARPWEGVREALINGPRSIQPASMLAPQGEAESEDCLYLNVWAPVGAESLPVMVWIHGGSFTTGSGGIVWYDGTRLAGRDVVVVAINYRLGALGFLDLESIGGPEWAGSANLGLTDQRSALEWVRDHIAAFGGDPSNVTLFGESAGAMSVSAHLAMPSSSGLFHRAIAQSGAARHVQTTEAAEATAAAVVSALGVDATDLGRLRDLPADRFREVVSEIEAGGAGTDLPLPFQPTVGRNELPMHPVAAIGEGSHSDGVAILTGTTSEEMKLFHLMATMSGAGGDLDDDKLARRVGRLLEAWGSDSDPTTVVSLYRDLHRDADGGALDNASLWTAISTDTTFRMPMYEMADAHVRAGGTVYTYMFAHRSTGFGGMLGAAHATEIPFVFDNLDQPFTEVMVGDITDERRQLADELASSWVAFAKGDPLPTPAAGGGTPQLWPPYDLEHRATVIVDVDSSVELRHHDALRRIWLGE